jgi:hypothetical protein
MDRGCNWVSCELGRAGEEQRVEAGCEVEGHFEGT